ncbi:hypothetical protein ACQKWADRAFT_307807 [Trichoderma austrokoningii]
MKFSIVLAVLPMAFAAPGALEAKVAARDAVSDYRKDACQKWNTCVATGYKDDHCDYDWRICYLGSYAGW